MTSLENLTDLDQEGHSERDSGRAGQGRHARVFGEKRKKGYWSVVVDIGGIEGSTLRLESLKPVFKPLHKFLVH